MHKCADYPKELRRNIGMQEKNAPNGSRKNRLTNKEVNKNTVTGTQQKNCVLFLRAFYGASNEGKNINFQRSNNGYGRRGSLW